MINSRTCFLKAAICLSIFLLQACGAVKPYYSKDSVNWEGAEYPAAEELVHSVFLIGDVGEPDADRQEPALRLLQLQLHGQGGTDTYSGQARLADSLKTVIFLGDNIYLDGLSEPGDPDREEEERRLIEQMKIVENWEGQPVWIPGNHDWNHSKPGGLEAVIRQEQFVRQYLNRTDVYLPGSGCPGPYPLEVNDKLVVILIDSEWWLTKHRRPEGTENGCGVDSELDFIVQLDDMLDRFKEKHVVLALHHPLMTNGNHGGHYSIGDHIFPLRLKYHNLYLPLPVIGSVYPLARMYGLSRQDLANPKYSQLSDAIQSVLKGRNNVTVAAGHEHNLQYNETEDIRHVLSGAGCKLTYCVGGRGASFVHKHTGFARINYYKNGEAWVEFWEPEEDGSKGRCVFRKALYALATPDDEAVEQQEIPDYTDSLKIIAANPQYKQAGKLSRKIWGEHYREEWITPVAVPYLDLERKNGGLRKVKKGGGQQTLSLHLMDKDSMTYYFRSVDKDPTGLLPEELQETFAVDFVKDQLSSAHPYGSLALAKLSSAAKVYHANPELYYMPYTPSLGPYLNEFGGMLGTFEMKADEDVSDYDNFGNAENAVGTSKLFEKLYGDNDNEVNQHSFVRARLFDMLINDYDRHEGQWRWAEFEKEGKGSVYEPIPKDRDQAFSKFDGIVPWLFTRKWLLRKFQHFDYDYGDVAGLNFNARYIDRRFLTGLSWNDWEEQVKFLQENLTDSVIEQSIRGLPPEIFAISGPEIIAKLKSRRDKLPAAAREYYEELSRYVDVVGSDKHEQFEVERLPDGKTRVVVHKTKKDGKVEHKLYERTFDPSLTKEIRLFGLDGIDKFFIRGKASSAIKIRIVGGEGEDILKDESDIRGPGKNIIYYDDEDEENELNAGNDTRLKLSHKDYVNKYNFEEFTYPYAGPRLSAEYNVDDGIFIGGGFNIKTYGFRKKPIATDQTFLGNYAFRTGAFTFKYRGRFYSLFSRNLDLMVDGDVYGPKYVFNYFGQGNSSSFERNIDYYRLHYNRVQFFPYVNWQPNEFVRIGAGPEFRYVDVGTDLNRGSFIDSDGFRQSSLYEEYTYMAGGRIFAEIKALNDDISPTRGLHWKNEISYMNSFRHDKVNLTRLRSDFVLYVSPNVNLRPTLALRVGGQKNLGDFLFYQSATLGQRENLRGFRRTRFAGHSSLYNNAELRIPVAKLSNYVFSGTWGVYGFVDQGRVWSNVEESDDWHRSYGPGLFLNLFNLFTASGSAGFSKEGPYFLINTGYFFD